MVAHGQRGRPGLVLAAAELVEDSVDLVAHAVHRRCHLVARRAQLLDLRAQRTPPCGEVGQDAPPCLLHLFEERSPLLLGPGHHLFALGARLGAHPVLLRGGLGQDALLFGPRLLLGAGHQSLHLDHPLGGGRLRAHLELLGLVLGLADQRRRRLLGFRHDPRRLLVGVVQDLCAVLAQRRGQRGLVDHGMGGPLLRLGHGRPQLLLLLFHALEGTGHGLEVGPHLVGVEPPPDDGERVPGDVTGGDPGR